MRILALDTGSYTGWALFEGTPSKNFLAEGNKITFGMWNLYEGKFEGAGWRYIVFKNKLRKLFEQGKIDIVFYEAVRRHMGTDAAHIYGGIVAHLQAFCEENRIPYKGVPIGTWKLHLTGKGNAGKPVVLEKVKELFGDVKYQDAADALGILKVGVECEL